MNSVSGYPASPFYLFRAFLFLLTLKETCASSAIVRTFHTPSSLFVGLKSREGLVITQRRRYGELELLKGSARLPKGNRRENANLKSANTIDAADSIVSNKLITRTAKAVFQPIKSGILLSILLTMPWITRAAEAASDWNVSSQGKQPGYIFMPLCS